MPVIIPFPAHRAGSRTEEITTTDGLSGVLGRGESGTPPVLLKRIAALALSMAEGEKLRVAVLAEDVALQNAVEGCFRAWPAFDLVGKFRWADASELFDGWSAIDLVIAAPPPKGYRIDPSEVPSGSRGLPFVLVVGGTAADLPPEIKDGVMGGLPKPFDRGAFRAKVEEVRTILRRSKELELVEKLKPLLAAATDRPHSAGRILVKSGNRIMFLKVSEIDWVEAQGDYVCLHAHEKKHLIREKISSVAEQLPRETFARIHRSTIINLDRVKEMQPLLYGEYVVILEDGTRLTMSRSFREKVFQGIFAAS